NPTQCPINTWTIVGDGYKCIECHSTQTTDKEICFYCRTSSLTEIYPLSLHDALPISSVRTSVFPARTRKVNANNSAALTGRSTPLIMFSVNSAPSMMRQAV